MEDIKYTIYESINDIDFTNLDYTLFDSNSTFTLDCDFSLYCQNDINVEKERIIWLYINKETYYLSHNELLSFLDFIIKQADNMNYKQVILIRAFNSNWITSKKCIGFMKKKINKYFFSLYKTHYVDELFNKKDLSKEICKLFNKYAADEQEHQDKDENEYIKTLSYAEAAHFMARKQVLNRVVESRKYNKRINLDKRYIEDNPVKYLNITCALRGIKCKVDFHNKPSSSNFTIESPRADEFHFSFCLNCFYNFFTALRYMYKHPYEEEYTIGNMTIHHKPIDCYCYFTGVQEDLMYEIFINNLSVVLCEDSYKMLYGTVINSPAFIEMFPKKAKKYIDNFEQQEEYTTLHTLQLLLNEEKLKKFNENLDFIKNRDRDLKKLGFEYEKQISQIRNEYQNEISKLENRISEQKKQLIEVKEKNKSFNKALSNSAKYNRSVAESITERIINCRQCSEHGNLTVIGSSLKNIKNRSLEWFNITFINGNVCSFEYNSNGLLAVFELRRKDLNFCFAFGIKSINIILEILDVALRTKSTPYNNDSDVMIIVTEKYNGVHCCKCGERERRLYTFNFVNYKFTLCEHCAEQFQEQLKYAKKTLEINKENNARKFIQQFFYN